MGRIGSMLRASITSIQQPFPTEPDGLETEERVVPHDAATEQEQRPASSDVLIRDSTFLVNTDFYRRTRFSWDIYDVKEVVEEEVEPEESIPTTTADEHRRRRIRLTTDVKCLEGELQNIKSQLTENRGLLKVTYERLFTSVGTLNWDRAVEQKDVKSILEEIKERETSISDSEKMRKEMEEQARWVRLML